MSAEGFFEASSPGRLDVMGGFADYSGSLVLQMPIREKTNVRVRLRNDYVCNLLSVLPDGKQIKVILNYRTLLSRGKVNYEHARKALSRKQDNHWIAYVLGCALVLQKAKGIEFKGADFEIISSVPLGKGVSSSAALEVATLKALTSALDLTLTGTEISSLAQMAENHVAGAPCGLMDQLTSYFGVKGTLLPILCQPNHLMPVIPLPAGLAFFGIDSGVGHSVGGSSYTDVRCAAFMGYTIIAKARGVEESDLAQAKKKNDFSGLPYQGYLANITLAEFNEKFRKLLPETLDGAAFLKSCHHTIDPVTTVKGEIQYKIAACASHPVEENHRVQHFLECLKAMNEFPNLDLSPALLRMGALMRASHESYSKCGLGSEATDEIVGLASTYSSAGIIGAKITGGGNGGTVCLLVSGEEGRKSAREIHDRLQQKKKAALAFFESSP